MQTEVVELQARLSSLRLKLTDGEWTGLQDSSED